MVIWFNHRFKDLVNPFKFKAGDVFSNNKRVICKINLNSIYSIKSFKVNRNMKIWTYFTTWCKINHCFFVIISNILHALLLFCGSEILHLPIFLFFCILKPNSRKKTFLTRQYWHWKIPVLILGWNITKKPWGLLISVLKSSFPRKVMAECISLYELLFQFCWFLIFICVLSLQNIKFHEHGSVHMKLQSFPLS